MCRKFRGNLAEIAKSSRRVKRIERVWTALLTLGHEREHELDVCDVGAPGLRAADCLALDRVRARHLTHRGITSSIICGYAREVLMGEGNQQLAKADRRPREEKKFYHQFSIAQWATMSSQARWRYQARSHLVHIFWYLTHRHAPPSNLYMSDLDSWLDSTPF